MSIQRAGEDNQKRGSWSKRDSSELYFPSDSDIQWMYSDSINEEGKRGSWNKRWPSQFAEPGSWSPDQETLGQRQPMNIEKRGSWSKRNQNYVSPIRLAERGSWSKRDPINIEDSFGWNEDGSELFPPSLNKELDAISTALDSAKHSSNLELRQPITDDGSDSKSETINVANRGSWSKRSVDGVKGGRPAKSPVKDFR